jgi:hypothetical protein
MSSETPHILAGHKRSGALDEIFVVDLGVHVNKKPAGLAPYCELTWRKSLEALEGVPQERSTRSAPPRLSRPSAAFRRIPSGWTMGCSG